MYIHSCVRTGGEGPEDDYHGQTPLVDAAAGLLIATAVASHALRRTENGADRSSHRHLDVNFRQVPESAGRCPSHGNAWASWHMQLRSRTVPQPHDAGWDACLDGSAEVKSG
ncbi:uncharacterized protein TrAtP1_004013 [Trichoderma atroviride]|uniref:uncharacterized protein n=1 Tax=Hypocrea atroviridis TaxID=63577 RepID=UPI00332ED793|nr:hypothetical protein TrAtP1_004013 [Trichoderma atroviride]